MISRQTLFERMIALWKSGDLFPHGHSVYEDTWCGSMDRFVEIAWRLQNHHRVLDVGTGSGILAVFLQRLGHECHAVDFAEPSTLLVTNEIPYAHCNAEIDHLPFGDSVFDAVTCCQCLEHFTHSHLFAVSEMYRVLCPGGLVEIDVPNAVCFRNRSRILRGKQITWDYEKHYLHSRPVFYSGHSFFPDRHNREFTLAETRSLLAAAGFQNIVAWHIRSQRYRRGLSQLRNLGSALRDAVPSLRKTIIAFGEKQESR